METLIAMRRWVLRRAENFVAALLASMFVAFILQIVFRYIFSLPVGWTVEWVTIAWLWGILFGYAFLVPENEAIRIDFVQQNLPLNWRRGCDVVTGLASAGLFAWTLPKTIGYISFMSIERTAFMLIPFSWVFVIYIAFAVSIIFRGLMTAWTAFAGTGPLYNSQQSAEVHDYE